MKYQFPLPVFFEGEQVGEYFADLIIDGKVILEIKSVECFSKAHIAQVLNYLHISKCRLGFLVNFMQPRCQYKRLLL